MVFMVLITSCIIGSLTTASICSYSVTTAVLVFVFRRSIQVNGDLSIEVSRTSVLILTLQKSITAVGCLFFLIFSNFHICSSQGSKEQLLNAIRVCYNIALNSDIPVKELQSMTSGHEWTKCVLRVDDNDCVSAQMVKYATGISKESIVDIEGTIQFSDRPLTGASQQVEVLVRKIHCISRSATRHPINVEDASRSEAEFENLGDLKKGVPLRSKQLMFNRLKFAASKGVKVGHGFLFARIRYLAIGDLRVLLLLLAATLKESLPLAKFAIARIYDRSSEPCLQAQQQFFKDIIFEYIILKNHHITNVNTTNGVKVVEPNTKDKRVTMKRKNCDLVRITERVRLRRKLALVGSSHFMLRKPVVGFISNASKSGASMKCAGYQGSGMKVSIRHLGPSMIWQMQHSCK
ncbi:Aspartyl-tRNA synthetase, cytoplasmic [Artemisia annua]|uniref:Aspartyl-tRNA synthetase, cytoplasmic n=1 Tax=Artemisia annua TaxID=35608 RepID=A0A2U1KZP6_ARTAN|nr:Aspartyl-tRNA synthetase, cytoplasmic [Artemisia annua]